MVFMLHKKAYSMFIDNWILSIWGYSVTDESPEDFIANARKKNCEVKLNTGEKHIACQKNYFFPVTLCVHCYF